LLPSAKCTRPLFQGRTGCGERPSGWHDIVTCQHLVGTVVVDNSDVVVNKIAEIPAESTNCFWANSMTTMEQRSRPRMYSPVWMVDKFVVLDFGPYTTLALDMTDRQTERRTDWRATGPTGVACVLSIDEAAESIVTPLRISYIVDCDLCCTRARFARAHAGCVHRHQSSWAAILSQANRHVIIEQALF